MSEPGPTAGCDPALAALLVPARPRLGAYEVCTTSDLPGLTRSHQGFRMTEPYQLEALDAFGTAGTFDRARMVQLYGGRRVDLRRGWRIVNGRFESITEISPYPDASLTVLHEGTLVIRWTVDLSPPTGRSAADPTVSRR